MSKKDRMLNFISNNVKWFLSTDSSVEVIPYYNMSSSVFSRAKEYYLQQMQCIVNRGGYLQLSITIITLAMKLLNLIFIMTFMRIE